MQDRDICNVYITEYGSTYVNVEFYGAVDSTFFTKEDLLSMLSILDSVGKSYPLDDGPLTQEQMEAIRKASSVSDLPEDRITRKLFEDN